MFLTQLIALCLCLSIPSRTGAEPTPVPPIILPKPAIPVTPPPPPPPVGVPVLAANGTYDVVSTSPKGYRVKTTPSGILKVTTDVVPAGTTLKSKANFFDGSSTKTYTGPCTVYTIEPIVGKSGRVEIEFTPYGFTSDSEIVSTILDVGEAPPQPKPIDPVPVDPTPVYDQFTKDLIVSYKADTDPKKATYVAQLASLYRVAASTTVQDASVTTNAILFVDLVTASDTLNSTGLLPKTALVGERKLVASRLSQSFPPSGKLDKVFAAKELTAIADALTAATTAK